MRQTHGLVVVMMWIGACGEPGERIVYVPIAGAGGGQGVTGGAEPSASSVGGSGGAAGTGGEAHGSGGSAGAAEGGGGAGGSGGAGGAGGSIDPGPTIVLSGLDRPGLLTCDGSRLFWASIATGDVSRANLDGSGQTRIANTVALGASDSEVMGGGVLYAIGGPNSRIVRVPITPGITTNVVQDADIRGFAVHDGSIYWFGDNTITGPSGVIHAAPRSLRGLAVDASGVYYMDSGDVYVVPLSGGTARRLAESSSTSMHTLTLDAEHVIWGTSSTLLRVTKGVGFPEVIAPVGVASLAFSSGTLAWMHSDEVYAKRGDAPHRLMAPSNGIGGVVLCGGFVFWASSIDGIIARALP